MGNALDTATELWICVECAKSEALRSVASLSKEGECDLCGIVKMLVPVHIED